MELKTKKVIYVTRDIERALGKTPSPEYLIVTNRTAYSEKIAKEYSGFITLVDNPAEEILSTTALLQADKTREVFDKEKESGGASLLVFKSSSVMENIAKANEWDLLNPPSSLMDKIEDKMSQITWLGELGKKYMPKYEVNAVKDIEWKRDPFIIQWARGFSGNGTMLIQRQEDLQALQAKFPDRSARVTTYIKGPSFTVNVVVTPDEVLTGNTSYQITGVAPFTDNAFSTVGNDWSLTHSLLSEKEIGDIEEIAAAIGAKMRFDGWKGLFGLDIIRDDMSDKISLIEINARQPASTTYESFLQRNNRDQGLAGPTVFEAHLASLTGEPVHEDLVLLNDGAQIIQRVTKTMDSIADETVSSLEFAGYNVIRYDNTAYNTDLLRIQSAKGIMETHNRFNPRGKEIMDILGNVH